MFSGPDTVGKKKISKALAEVIFGRRECLISIDLNFGNQTPHPSSIFDRQSVNFCDPSFRGKTITDFIAEELNKKPRSVVLLENIDKADFVTQENLSLAIRTGKLLDTRGRDIHINDTIFVITSNSSKETDTDLSYPEERILKAKALQMRISAGSVTEPRSSSILLLPRQSTSRNSVTSNKRKLIEIGEFEIRVPAVKRLKSCFDLNLPVDEAEDDGNSDKDTVSETKEAWLEEFSGQIDGKVELKPYDFDSRAQTILKEIGIRFQKSFGPNVVLEIENEVVLQMLASDWLSERKGCVETWIETILHRGFTEAKEKHQTDAKSMVKLSAVEGVAVEDEPPCVFLPSRIESS